MKPVAWNEATLSTAMRDPVALEFWKIVCVGDFEDQTKSLFVVPRFRSILGVKENGYYVITPLIPRLIEPGR